MRVTANLHFRSLVHQDISIKYRVKKDAVKERPVLKKTRNDGTAVDDKILQHLIISDTKQTRGVEALGPRWSDWLSTLAGCGEDIVVRKAEDIVQSSPTNMFNYNLLPKLIVSGYWALVNFGKMRHLASMGIYCEESTPQIISDIDYTNL